MGRRVAAVTTTLLTGLLIWHAASAIYRDSFTDIAPDPRDASCAQGIRDLHARYQAHWISTAPRAERVEITSLDRRLEGLRGLCAREGPDGSRALRHFERWRYRADDHAAFGRDLLDDDARLALAYQSPGTLR